MASMWPVMMMFLIFVSLPSLLLAVSTSSISAAPALLPDSPLASPPALSPDISPLFPSPAASGPSPSESSFPTIPSSPSPPNPDAMATPGPFNSLPPFGALETASSHQLQVSAFLTSAIVSAFFLLLWW